MATSKRHEILSAGASVCAVCVSIFSTVISCSSQRDVEQVKQIYALCNTKIDSLNTILRSRFTEAEIPMREIMVTLYNGPGIMAAPTALAEQKVIYGDVQSLDLSVNRIWREVTPYLTGDRETRMQALFDNKNAASLATVGKNDPSLTNAYLGELFKFFQDSPKIMVDEIRTSLKGDGCNTRSAGDTGAVAKAM